MDTGHKFEVHKAFKSGPRRFLNVLCIFMFDLHPVSIVHV